MNAKVLGGAIIAVAALVVLVVSVANADGGTALVGGLAVLVLAFLGYIISDNDLHEGDEDEQPVYAIMLATSMVALTVLEFFTGFTTGEVLMTVANAAAVLG